MIYFSDKAREKIHGFLKGMENAENLMLRVAVSGQGAGGFTYDFFLDESANRRQDDFLMEEEGFTAAVDAQSLRQMVGATVDWKDTVEGSGFDVDNPNQPKPAPPAPSVDLNDPLARKLQDLIDQQINPGVASHGGLVTLMGVDKDKVFLRMGGGCQGCGQADVTLKQGIETMIKEAVPEIAHVIDVTDHAGGANPYYQPAE